MTSCVFLGLRFSVLSSVNSFKIDADQLYACSTDRIKEGPY